MDLTSGRLGSPNPAMGETAVTIKWIEQLDSCRCCSPHARTHARTAPHRAGVIRGTLKDRASSITHPIAADQRGKGSICFCWFLRAVEENKGPTRSQSPQMISAVACELVPRCASHEQVLSLLRDSWNMRALLRKLDSPGCQDQSRLVVRWKFPPSSSV